MPKSVSDYQAVIYNESNHIKLPFSYVKQVTLQEFNKHILSPICLDPILT